jgi:uncharacterized protein YcaQ
MGRVFTPFWPSERDVDAAITEVFGRVKSARRRERLSAAEARRVALAAQGFGDGMRERPVDGWTLRRLFDRVGILQIDSVNVLSRAHYQPLFSRAGAYDTSLLDRASQRQPRRLFEYWGHEASLIPVELQPLLRWRMDRAAHEAWGGMRRVNDERPDLVRRVLEEVRDRGPIRAADISHEEPKRTEKWWGWSDVKRAVEFLFWSGQVSSARRTASFERLYDLPERVLPASVIAAPTPSEADAQRELLKVAARALGVAGEPELRDYFRLPVADARLRIAELTESGDLMPVEVEGWRTPGYVASGARVPRRVDARALIGPFDPLIWERGRVERVFGFTYRLEIYVPAPKRVHGYYVLPFLLGDRLVARADLKADRQAGVLRARAHLEPHAPETTVEALQEELTLMAGWLGLPEVAFTLVPAAP